MSDRSAIEWTDATWNPVRGCSKVSPGCKFCYAEVFSERFRGVPGHPFEQGFDLRLVPEKLEQPLHWRRPRKIFVNSMSDLFHEQVPAKFIDETFAVMERASQHTYQVLTKRPERALEVLSSGAVRPVPDHVWIGVSIESSRFTWRADVLRQIPARVRFISAEPLLGSLLEEGPRRAPVNLTGIEWVIVGGESGPRARPMLAEWAREVRDTCVAARVPFFFKQWGGKTAKAGGRLLDSALHDEMPAIGGPTRRTELLFREGTSRAVYRPSPARS
jgi:protein gp37